MHRGKGGGGEGEEVGGEEKELRRGEGREKEPGRKYPGEGA